MKKSSEKNKVQFWYPLKYGEQLAFTGQRIIVPLFQEGHILYQGRLLCKQSMERLKGEAGAKQVKIVSVRAVNVPLCKKCQESYKNIPGMDWEKWVNPPDLKYPAAPKLNPEIVKVNNEEK